MRSFRPSRKRAAGEHREESEPLGKLQKRCTGGAIGASSAYLAVLTTTVVRPSAMSDPVTIGLLIGFGTMAGLCAVGAVLARAEARYAECTRASDRSRVDELDWAIQFGGRIADAFPDRGAPNSAPRGPIIR